MTFEWTNYHKLTDRRSKESMNGEIKFMFLHFFRQVWSVVVGLCVFSVGTGGGVMSAFPQALEAAL